MFTQPCDFYAYNEHPAYTFLLVHVGPAGDKANLLQFTMQITSLSHVVRDNLGGGPKIARAALGLLLTVVLAKDKTMQSGLHAVREASRSSGKCFFGTVGWGMLLHDGPTKVFSANVL